MILTNPPLNNPDSPARLGFCVGEMFLTAIQKVQTTARR